MMFHLGMNRSGDHRWIQEAPSIILIKFGRVTDLSLLASEALYSSTYLTLGSFVIWWADIDCWTAGVRSAAVESSGAQYCVSAVLCELRILKSTGSSSQN